MTSHLYNKFPEVYKEKLAKEKQNKDLAKEKQNKENKDSAPEKQKITKEQFEEIVLDQFKALIFVH